MPTTARTPTVAIIGAGFGGVAAAVNLTRRGIRTFTVFETSDGPGGTWWDNRYPGAECDVPSALYSYSFKLYDWTRTHATQAEIQEYVEEVIDDYGMRPNFRFGRGVRSVEWHEDRMQYLVELAHGPRGEAGDTGWFDVVVSAVGMLNVPNIPAWAIGSSFRGPIMHSARWDPTADLAGKRVAVVGAGASAAQIVPGLQPIVGELLTFQRQPGWVFPKGDRDYTPEERRRLDRFGRRRRERWKVLRATDKGLKVASDPAAAARAVKRGTDYIGQVFADRPDLAEALTPDFQPRCKRNIQSSAFYPALLQPNVRLVTRSVERLTEAGVLDDRGVEHEVDAVVLATGFQAANFLGTYDVVGRSGRTLRETWGEDPHAYLGITVPEFPNFYIMYGPNTHGTVVSYVLERQAEFIARDVRRLARVGGGAIEVRPEVETRFQERLQTGIAGVAAWKSGCNNWYESASGRNIVQWPWSHDRYRWLVRSTRRSSSTLRPLTPAARAARTRIRDGAVLTTKGQR